MCLIIFDWQPNAKRVLTLASNRDEYYQRPSSNAHYWHEHPHIFGGRDLKMQGTWLAISTNMRLAAITNFRRPDEKQYARSRGEIPSHFLNSKLTALKYAEQLSDSEYAGFNALFFDGEQLVYCHNQKDIPRQKERNDDKPYRILLPGQYGLSNHFLDTPWPKVQRSKPALQKIASEADPKLISDVLLNALQDQTIAPDELLPNTGIATSFERLLSPIFITSSIYGTRTGTAIIVEKKSEDSANFHFQERQYQEHAEKFTENIFSLAGKKQSNTN